MVALNRVERLRQPPGLDSYHQMLASDIAGQLLLHRLPGLADLPLELADADGAPCRLEALLQRHRHLTLAGASGSGRQLAMLQYALRWATGAEPSASAPVTTTALSTPSSDRMRCASVASVSSSSTATTVSASRAMTAAE